MRYIFLVFISITILSCENNSFDKDKRQLIAKDEIRGKLKNVKSFDITGFQEDTLHDLNEATFKESIRYKLNIRYQDSTGGLQNKEAFVIFTPDGHSIINSQINN